jgi:hypothetical protein
MSDSNLTNAEKDLVENLRSAPAGDEGVKMIAQFLVGDIKSDKKEVSEALLGSAIAPQFKDSRELDPTVVQQKLTESVERQAKTLENASGLTEEASAIRTRAESLKKPEIAEAVKEAAGRGESQEKEATPQKQQQAAAARGL